jgi:hypothetical protein
LAHSLHDLVHQPAAGEKGDDLAVENKLGRVVRPFSGWAVLRRAKLKMPTQ